MPWRDQSPEDRKQSDAFYSDPEYKRNKIVVRRRSGGRCEVVEDGRRCSSRKGVQCDHIVPRVQGGGHGLGNLRDTCSDHHRAKTAQEGGGWRSGKRRKPDPPVQPRTQW
jgi:5-methylcytosine-specific restriction endonuclease McrA